MIAPAGHVRYSPPRAVDLALTFLVRGAVGLWLFVLALSIVHLV